MELTKPVYKITELHSKEDLGALMMGDVVKAELSHQGETFKRDMAITWHAIFCKELPESLSFSYRMSPGSIYHQVRIEGSISLHRSICGKS